VSGGQTLSRDERIRRRPEFERIYDRGARISGRFMTVFVLDRGLPTPRLGVAATRKLGGAVARNRAKRLAREIFRRHKAPNGCDIVIVPRREMLDAPFASLEADYDKALERRSAARRGPHHQRRVGRGAGAGPRV
jgi:ribonuclease P protein component